MIKIILAVATTIAFLSSTCFAGIGMSEKLPITKKLRYVANNTYVASFISPRSVNYSLINKRLVKHFSQEIEKNVDGSIRENTKEEGELILEIIKEDGTYQGEVRIGINAFTRDGKFIYRVGELHHALETALGFKFKFSNIRTSSGKNLKKMDCKDNDFIVFEP